MDSEFAIVATGTRLLCPVAMIFNLHHGFELYVLSSGP